METWKDSLLFYCASAMRNGMFKDQTVDSNTVPLENIEQGLHQDVANDEVMKTVSWL